MRNGRWAVGCAAVAFVLSCGALTARTNARADESTASAEEGVLAPRLVVHSPSISKLISEAQRARSGALMRSLFDVVMARSEGTLLALDLPRLEGLLKQSAELDASIDAYVFAPDIEGKARWAVRFSWPLEDLRLHLKAITEIESLKEVMEGVDIRDAEGHLAIRVNGEPIAFLIEVDSSHSAIASHHDVPLPSESSDAPQDDDSILTFRLNLTGTEQDSGATFLSTFSAVTSVSYKGHVDESGVWSEEVNVAWPMISGMGVKALVDRVKQTFFVPDEAFGAITAGTSLSPGMFESMSGLGPQVIMESPGEMMIVGEAAVGAIASNIDSEFCVTALPGTGFLPAPDIIAQVRTRHVDRLMDELADAADMINDQLLEREQPPTWHKADVLDHKVLWNEGSHYPGAIMPFVFRPVLFVTSEKDAKDRERHFMVMAWTTTSPESFVRRWLNYPRTKGFRYLPTETKTNGQIWVNWEQIYGYFSPYMNVAIGAVTPARLLPDEKEADLSDAMVSAKVSYTGLAISHSGPIPMAVAMLPPMVATAAAPAEDGGSDLARERLATQRLKLFYHHAKLFKKDVGRWPAEVAELDGYIDFAGHPELLRLDVSSSKRWHDWFEDMFGGEDEQEENEGEEVVDDPTAGINDRVYVVKWKPDSWQLGLADGTLEHLESLYIDQDGVLHRIPKKESADKAETEQGETAFKLIVPDEDKVEKTTRQAARNIEQRTIDNRECALGEVP